MSKKLEIRVASTADMAKDFVTAWHKVERGERLHVRRVTFDSLQTLLKTLTDRRWELLQRLHEEGAMTVLALSKLLERDYKNVHTDVAELESAGLVARDERGRVMVSWDEVTARMRLSA